MLFSKITIASFIALVSLIEARPIDFLSGDNNDGIVLGSGNGGNGGTNLAIPIVESSASSKHSKGSTSSLGGNIVGQSANGGSGTAIGTFGEGNTLKRGRPVNVDPSISVLSNDNNDGIVAASGNGGLGGTNIAVPIVESGAKSKGSSGSTSSTGANEVGQSANGGSGTAIGSLGEWNHLKRGHHKSEGSNDNNDGIVYGSGNGGNGGENVAVPIVVSGAQSFGSWGDTSSEGVNEVGQSANGGSGTAIGTFGSGNQLKRGHSKSVASNDNNDGIVFDSGNGGNGGENVAIPVVISGAKSKGSWGSTSSTGANVVSQSANGGPGTAIGTFGQGNTLKRGGSWESILSGDNNDGIVVGSGNGGNGGTNFAIPIVESGASSKHSSGKTSSTGANEVGQSANGGSGTAIGSFGSGNTLKRGGGWESILSNDNNDGAVIDSGNGGNGGTNFALPIVVSGASSKHSGGKTTSEGVNEVGQSADGGSGTAIGTFGKGNTLKRGGGSWKSILSNDNNDGIVAGSGNGGNGGENVAVPIVISGASSKHSGGKTTSEGANEVGQSADGGSGTAIGTFGENNHL